MTDDEQLQAAEAHMRDLLDHGGLPQPDEVEYRTDEIVLRWHETKTAVVVDLREERTAASRSP